MFIILEFSCAQLSSTDLDKRIFSYHTIQQFFSIIYGVLQPAFT